MNSITKVSQHWSKLGLSTNKKEI